MKLRPVQFVFLVLLLSSLRGANASSLPGGEFGMNGRYVGTVLCRDCAGIWTEITLVDSGPNLGSGSGTFVLVERFTGGIHGGATLLTQGEWSTVAWVKESNYTGTIELRPANQGSSSSPSRFLFCDHGRLLRVLNQDRSPISTARPVALDRVVPPQEPRFSISLADSGATMYARIGDTFILALPAASLAAYRTAWTMKPPASQCVTIYTITGSGDGDLFSSDFTLKAAAPGKAHLEFQGAEQPTRSVAFEFEVLP